MESICFWAECEPPFPLLSAFSIWLLFYFGMLVDFSLGADCLSLVDWGIILLVWLP